MHNKNTIDDIVRNALQDGQERLNLGSWANMERMLNGQNPYAQPAQDEEEKKKRGFWLFGLLFAGILLLGGSIYKYATTTKQPALMANTDAIVNPANNTQNNTTIKQTNLPTTANPTANNNASNSIDDIQATTTNNQTVNHTNYTATTNNNYTANANTNYTATIDGNNTTQDNPVVNNKVADNTTTNVSTTNTTKSKKIRQAKNVDNATTQSVNNTSKDDLVIDAKPTTISVNAELANVTTSKATTDKELHKEPKAKNRFQKLFAKKEKKPKEIKAEQSLNIDNSTNGLSTIINKSKQTKPADSVTAVSIKYKKRKSEDGIVQTKEITITKSKNNVAEPITAPELFVSDGSIHPQKYNPRLLELTAEEDLKASAKPGVIKPRTKTPTEAVVDAQQPQTINNSTANATKIAAPTKVAKPKAAEASKAMQAMENVKEAAKKLGYLGLFSKKIETNPGVFAGINGSFFNAKHNFGGFQAGSNLLIKLSETFSIIPHLGFYYRNNGGYSVKDFTTNIINKSTSYSTDSLTKIFSYTMDSTQLSYNFKHVYNIEAPIIFNYAKRDFGFYAGVNLSYGLQMKPTNTAKQYSVNKDVTMSVDSPATSFSFPTNQNTFYKSTDFQSRFGVGYVVGMSYDFHPNLYVDFRMTQIAKDNSGTVSAIEMSKQFFRVPSMQIGIGYRFKEKERVRYK